jgi:uncharacterized protein YkwD
MTDHLRQFLPGLLLAVLACTSGCAAETGESDDEVDEASEALTNNELETRIIAEINQRRVARGLQKVAGGACIDEAAESWAGHLVSTGKFVHQDMSPLLGKCNALWTGETLAGGSAIITASQWVTAWMNSDSHREIILKPRADRVGVAVRTRPNGDLVIVADFLDKPNE